MRILALIFSSIIFSSSVCYSQEDVKQLYPTDVKTKMITYTDVVEMPGLSANDLYERAFRWANEYYVNPNDVIREKDVLLGRLFCKARFQISNPANKKGVVTNAGRIMYSLLLEFKDDKYRYKIDDINWIKPSKYPIENWMDTENQYYKNVYADYLQQSNDHCIKLVQDLLKGMEKSVEEASDDW